MSEWREVKLGDIADEVTVGHVGSMAQEYRSDGIPLLRSQNVLPHGFDLKDVKYIDRDFHARLKKSALRAGDVVTVRTGKPGATAVVPAHWAEANCSDLVITRPGSGINAHWLSYYINSAAAGYIDSQLVGAVQQHFNVGAAKNMTLYLPPLFEQEAIAEVLGALDDKIAANTKLAQTSAILAQTLFAGSVHAADHEVALSDVTALLTRGVAPKYSDADDTVVVLNQKCIRDQRVNLGPARRTLVSKVRGDKLLRMDDVLVNSTGQGTLGRVARWTNGGSVTVDSHITIVRFDQAKVDAVCAGMALLTSQKTIEEMGEGSTGQTELSRSELGKLRMRLPERSRQAELGHRIKSMSEMESARLNENQTLAATRDTLLPQLMSGKLRVKDAVKVLENVGV